MKRYTLSTSMFQLSNMNIISRKLYHILVRDMKINNLNDLINLSVDLDNPISSYVPGVGIKMEKTIMDLYKKFVKYFEHTIIKNRKGYTVKYVNYDFTDKNLHEQILWVECETIRFNPEESLRNIHIDTCTVKVDGDIYSIERHDSDIHKEIIFTGKKRL